MRWISLFLALLITGGVAMALVDTAVAQDLATPGVSRELATWRSAHYRDVAYALDITLQPPFQTLQGRLRLQFTVDALDGDLILDWRPERDSALNSLIVNGAPLAEPRTGTEHLRLERSRLRPGVNQIELEFSAPVRSAGTALTRYRDSEDGTDYVYSLFVPADASSVFPCFDQPDLKARFTLNATVPAG